MEHLAKIAYEAALTTLKFQEQGAVSHPDFDNLPQEQKNQWFSAAYAVRQEVVNSLKILWN